MNLLAIDTSSQMCSVALIHGDTITHQSKNAPREHTKLILPMIEDILKKTSLSLTQLNVLAFGAGPGSFTGVRIATGVIQGLAYALDLPVVPISTLAALAQNAYRTYKVTHILPALDARMNQIYWGGYETDENGLVRPLSDDRVCHPEQIQIPKDGQWIGVGSGWLPYKDTLRPLLKDHLKEIHPDTLLDAYDIALLAEAKFQQGEYVSADNALPIYLREKVV